MNLYANHSRDELIEEIEEYRTLCDQLSSILTRTANALKGEPKPLHRHRACLDLFLLHRRASDDRPRRRVPRRLAA